MIPARQWLDNYAKMDYIIQKTLYIRLLGSPLLHGSYRALGYGT
jgi:hypothetical protein